MINQTPVVLTESRDLLAGDSGQTLLYFGAPDITLHVPDALPRGFGCEAVQLGQGLIRFDRTSPVSDVSLSSTIEAGVQTVGMGSSIVLWFLSARSYATRVVGAVEGSGGAVGPMGPPGPPGPTGADGVDGAAGVQGPAGDPGQTGPRGPQGVAGAVGATGATGAVGADGAPGAKGDKGDPGQTGAAGANGATGAPGVDGAPGVAGPQGFPGPQGLQGVKGDTGAAGAVGVAGPEGPTAVSADSGNLARLGTDSLLLVPDISTLKGVTNGLEAAPGTIGEYKVVANTVGVTLPSATPTQICPIHLEAGDWEIWGSVDFAPAPGVSPNMVAASVSIHPNALPNETDLMTGVGILNMITTNALTSGQRQMLMTGQCRSNSAAALDLYLVAQTTLGGTGLLTAKGYICARRAR